MKAGTMNIVKRIAITILMVLCSTLSFGLAISVPANSAPSSVNIQLVEKGASSGSSGPAVCVHSFTGDGLVAKQPVYVTLYQQKALVGSYLLGYVGPGGNFEQFFEFNTLETSSVPSGVIKAVFSYQQYSGTAIGTVTYKVVCP